MTCISIAGFGKHEVNEHMEVSIKGKNDAETFHKLLEDAKELLIEKVHDQTST